MKSLKWPAWREASWRLSVKLSAFRAVGRTAGSARIVEEEVAAGSTLLILTRPAEQRQAGPQQAARRGRAFDHVVLLTALAAKAQRVEQALSVRRVVLALQGQQPCRRAL